MKMPEV